MEELVRRSSDWWAVGSREANTQETPLPDRPPKSYARPALACVTRATAELPSFHTGSAARSYERGQRRKCSPVVALSTLVTNRQSMAITNALNGRPIYMHALCRLALEGTWIQSSLDRKALSLRKNIASLGFRASRTRVELASN